MCYFNQLLSFVNLGIVPIWDPIHYRGRSGGTSRSSPSFNQKFASLLDSEIPLSKLIDRFEVQGMVTVLTPKNLDTVT